MLDVTTPPFCQLVRLINPDVELFSEMLVDNMILNANRLHLDERVANYPKDTVIQLGGSDKNKIAQSVRILRDNYGYTRFNLNCGCPSDKVKKGAFGASLMKNPNNVADIINQVFIETNIVISIKCRIGIIENKSDNMIDDLSTSKKTDRFDFFYNFIKIIKESTPCKTFYVHCRVCMLYGLSPKNNRCIPKLQYSYAHKIKTIFPDLEIIVNGGIKLPYDKDILNNCDGVMIGRMAMDEPLCFRTFIDSEEKSEFLLELISKYLSCIQIKENLRMYHLSPIFNLRKGMKNSKQYKQILINAMRNKIAVDELKKELICHINDNR